MDVSIIFVNYKTKDLTINAINSVIEKTEDIKCEIFVVDNNSQDGSIEAIQEEFNGIELAPHPSLPREGNESSPLTGRGREGCTPIYIIKNQTNAGFGAANNLAIKQAKGKYILCLNTDTLLINNAIKIMFDFMEKDENQNVGVCGGYLIDKNGNPCMAGGHFPSLSEVVWKLGLRNIFKNTYNKFFAIGLTSDEIIKYNCAEHIIGADIFFRKEVLDKVGLFDEKFFMYREETDLCKRIHNEGFDIKFVPEAQIIHFDGGSTANNINKKIRFKTSEIYYFKKHYPYQLFLIKFIYIILYLFSYIVLKNNDNKELLKLMVK